MGGSVLRINQGWSKYQKKAELKIKELIETNASYALRELAKITGISLSNAHFILKCYSVQCFIVGFIMGEHVGQIAIISRLNVTVFNVLLQVLSWENM